jgi:hypothetical protein
MPVVERPDMVSDILVDLCDGWVCLWFNGCSDNNTIEVVHRSIA